MPLLKTFLWLSISIGIKAEIPSKWPQYSHDFAPHHIASLAASLSLPVLLTVPHPPSCALCRVRVHCSLNSPSSLLSKVSSKHLSLLSLSFCHKTGIRVAVVSSSLVCFKLSNSSLAPFLHPLLPALFPLQTNTQSILNQRTKECY